MKLQVIVYFACALLVGLPHVATANDTFMSQNIVGLLTEQEDSNLSKQALMGVASATTIKRFVDPEQARVCTTLFNSYLTLTDFPLTAEQGTQYSSLVTKALANSKNIKYLEFPKEDSQACGIFTGFSVVQVESKKKVYELIVYLFDWQRARASGVKGADAFIRGGVLAFVRRTMIESSEKPSKSELGSHSFPMFESMLAPTLSAMRITN